MSGDVPLQDELAMLLERYFSQHPKAELALIEYREAVARDPDHALAWCGLVRASMRARDLDVARQAYERLAALSAVLSNRIADEFPEVLQ